MGEHPLVFAVRGNSLDDGPGIRTVVFFKGCPLSCVWCHNPEGIGRRAELSFDQTLCIGCDSCVAVCESKALDRERPGFVDRERCDRSFACAFECPSGALSRVGEERSVAELVELVVRDKPFYDASGGGLTLSGGEPTMQMDAAAELARRAKDAGVHVLLETCGLFDAERFFDRLYPHLDMIYCDLKIADSDAHKRYCGVGNERIAANVAALVARANDGGVEVLPRVPLVPGITATEPNLRALAVQLRAAGARRVALLEYNPTWTDKAARLAPDRPLPPEFTPDQWMSEGELAACKAAFPGLEVVDP